MLKASVMYVNNHLTPVIKHIHGQNQIYNELKKNAKNT